MQLSLETLPMYCTEEGECLLWNLGTNGVGYPIARLDGKGQGVRRYVYIQLMGGNPGRKRLSSLCGNPLCVSPACMRPISVAQLIREGYRNGQRNPAREVARGRAGAVTRGWSVLSMEKAREIRARGTEKRAPLAAEYGVCVDTIRKIQRGVIWAETSPFDHLLRKAA